MTPNKNQHFVLSYVMVGPPNSTKFIWKGKVFFLSGKSVAEIVLDEEWPNMWRVKIPGRPLSDMVNLTRAKDAAVRLVQADLRIK
jgi:hypothetical protein